VLIDIIMLVVILTLIGIMAIHNVFNNRGNAKVLFITKDGLQSFLMFFGMIFSVSVIAYWSVYEKRRRVYKPLLVGNTTSEEIKRILT